MARRTPGYDEADDEPRYAVQRCPQCKKTFRVLPDEQGMHDCPRCGWSEAGPADGPCPDCGVRGGGGTVSSQTADGETVTEACPTCGTAECAACQAFNARFQCGKATHLECDCPKCQGYCTCPREQEDEDHDPHCTCPDCLQAHIDHLGEDASPRPTRINDFED